MTEIKKDKEKDMSIWVYQQRIIGKTFSLIAKELRQISEDCNNWKPYSPSMAKRLSIKGKSYLEVNNDYFI